MTITKYQYTNIEDFEDFLNNLYIGLKHYEKIEPTFKFNISWGETCITLKTLKQRHEELN